MVVYFYCVSSKSSCDSVISLCIYCLSWVKRTKSLASPSWTIAVTKSRFFCILADVSTNVFNIVWVSASFDFISVNATDRPGCCSLRSLMSFVNWSLDCDSEVLNCCYDSSFACISLSFLFTIPTFVYMSFSTAVKIGTSALYCFYRLCKAIRFA